MLRKNDEKAVCAPIIINVDACRAGRTASSDPMPLRNQRTRIEASAFPALNETAERTRRLYGAKARAGRGACEGRGPWAEGGSGSGAEHPLSPATEAMVAAMFGVEARQITRCRSSEEAAGCRR